MNKSKNKTQGQIAQKELRKIIKNGRALLKLIKKSIKDESNYLH